MSQRGIRSLPVVLNEVRRERNAQLRHWDALDSKSGIILGFAGAIVALTPTGRSWLVDGARYLAAASGLFALWTFWPRRYWAIDLRNLRDLYLGADPEFTQVRLLDTQVEMVQTFAHSLHGKAQRLKASMLALAAAAALAAVGLSVH